jgi:zinc resistance-associated protein
MKKAILIVAAAAFTALIGTQAYACYWDGYWGGPMGGPMAGYQNGNYQGFYDQTAQLRQDLAAKQGEYNALLATSNPDPKQAAELNREIAVLRDQLTAQARSYALPPANGGYYGRMGGYGCW